MRINNLQCALITASALAWCLMASASAMAQSATWVFSDDHCTASTTDALGSGSKPTLCDGFATSRSFVEQGHGTGEGTYDGSGDLVHLSGWATTADQGTQRNVALERGHLIDASDTTGSYGLRNADATGPRADRDGREAKGQEQAFDNNQRTDLLLLEFERDWVLTELLTDDAREDADISVLYYDGVAPTGGGEALVADKTVAELLASGWNTLGHYATDGAYVGTYDLQDVNADPDTLASSSYWLIGAYIPGIGGNCFGVNMPDCSRQIAGYNDRFRISGVSTATPTGANIASADVDEPWTLALLAIGLPWMWRRSRRYK